MKNFSARPSWLATSLVVAGTLGLLGGCGGSSGGVASTPTPPSTPNPQPSPTPQPSDTSVELLDHPATQEFATARRGEPIRIRYDAAKNLYEIKTAEFDWSPVVDMPDVPGSNLNQTFAIAGPAGTTSLTVRTHHRSTIQDNRYRYRYSNLAVWYPASYSTNLAEEGVALGVPTPASGVPLTGSATYAGIAHGMADVPNLFWGMGPIPATPVGGNVSLNFNFETGALTGSLTLFKGCDCTTDVTTGSIAFGQTFFAPGSQTFSGTFGNGVPGPNSFDGLFTGPGAEELIGSWTVPFMLDGNVHSAWGAMIAKRGN